eukprot:snap_masked-scaffold_15-processed-gene-8.33-mRNA-1 protein AED:0.38 eAED:0.38 QI:0/0/0/0.5/1/1/4/0/999
MNFIFLSYFWFIVSGATTAKLYKEFVVDNIKYQGFLEMHNGRNIRRLKENTRRSVEINFFDHVLEVPRQLSCTELRKVKDHKLNSLLNRVNVTEHFRDGSSKTSEMEYTSNNYMSADGECFVSFSENGQLVSGTKYDEFPLSATFEFGDCEEPTVLNASKQCIKFPSDNDALAPKCGTVDDEEQKVFKLQSKNLRNLANEPLPFKLDLWNDCYNAATELHELAIGVSVGSNLLKQIGGSENLLQYIELIVANTNVFYYQQLNVKLVVHAVEFVSEEDAGSVLWDNHDCQQTIQEQLKSYKKVSRPSRQGIWHLMDDCYGKGVNSDGGAIGLAHINAVCSDSTANVATTWYNDAGGTWLIFAHEVGHLFGAQHTWEEGVGETGGIMDYGDRLYNPENPLTEYQFNRKYRFDDICDIIKEELEDNCPYWSSYTLGKSGGTCGNGVLEDHEECECPPDAKDPTDCGCCKNCQLQGTEAVCSPFGNDCCTEECTYQPTTEMCQHSDGPGYCRNGHCASAQCHFIGWGDYCGVVDEDEPCRKRCVYQNFCTQVPKYTYKGRNLQNFRDGAFCQTAEVAYGQCFDGTCVEVEKEGAPPSIFPTEFPTKFPTTSSPTPYPTDEPTYFPTNYPSQSPTLFPSEGPTNSPTVFPTDFPTPNPTNYPTRYPTLFPTEEPTTSPTSFPTDGPTFYPTLYPSKSPTLTPSKLPTSAPTSFPTDDPTPFPTEYPISEPTEFPTWFPTDLPTNFPSEGNTRLPTSYPTRQPTGSEKPTQSPTFLPTLSPSSSPSVSPTFYPTSFPTLTPTKLPTVSTNTPTTAPVEENVDHLTTFPTTYPTSFPTIRSTDTNSSGSPSFSPSTRPTTAPSVDLEISFDHESDYCCEELKLIYGRGNFLYYFYNQAVCSNLPSPSLSKTENNCKSLNLLHARDECESIGARLCTMSELRDLVAGDINEEFTQCGLTQSTKTWTQTRCSSGFMVAQLQDGLEERCVPAEDIGADQYQTLCCADSC